MVSYAEIQGYMAQHIIPTALGIVGGETGVWFEVTVFIPILLPMFFVMMLPSVEGTAAGWGKILKPIKEGQLAWMSATFCVSALYELCGAIVGGKVPEQIGLRGAVFVASMLAILLVTSGLCGTSGLLSAPRVVDGRSVERWGLFTISICVMIATSYIFKIVHFALEQK
jgi:hypothetical protein